VRSHRPLLAHHVKVGLDGGEAADAGGHDQTDPHRVEWEAVGPASVGDSLIGGNHGELGKAVEPPRLLYGKVLGGIERIAVASSLTLAHADAADPLCPPLMQRTCAHPERSYGTDSGDYGSTLVRHGASSLLPRPSWRDR
jgi:hypothetical protein